MNHTVELVRLWGEYENLNPNTTIDDFCRDRLYGTIKKDQSMVAESQMRPDLNGALIKLIRRIGKFHIVYTGIALAGTGLDQIEEFGMLVTIYNQTNPRKSEVIYSNILDLSSGTNMLIRLMKKGLITEYDDKEDKRVKRLELTKAGKKTLTHAKEQVLKVVAMLAQDLTDADKHLCMKVLTPIDTRFSAIIQKQKNKPFEEIYNENCAAARIK